MGLVREWENLAEPAGRGNVNENEPLGMGGSGTDRHSIISTPN